MSIPEGYRLLTSADIGKTFGVELEPTFYIDNSVSIQQDTNYFWLNLGNSFSHPSLDYPVYYLYHDVSGSGSVSIYFMDDDTNFIYLNTSGTWTSSIDFSQPFSMAYSVDDPISFSDSFTDSLNNFFYVKDKDNRTPKEKFVDSVDSLAKSITDKAGTTGKKSITELKGLVDNLKTTFTGQEKTVTPSKTSQVITPDTSYDGLSKVTVNPIPTDYIIPSGTLEVTENGTKDVTNYKSVNVNVPTPEPTYWDGSYTLSGLGYTVTLNVDSNLLNSDTYTYSLDSGSTWEQFTSATMTLDNVSKIKFKETAYGYVINVGTTSSGYDVVSTQSGESEDIEITEDTTWYVSRDYVSGGAN